MGIILITTCFVFFFGLCIGSFLNVCIHRIPISLSIVHPRSRCPVCEKPISGWDNIPLFSYLLLGGKCRHCRTPISWRYPLVELLTGLMALAVYGRYGLGHVSLIYFAFIACLITISFIDFDHYIIPNIISLPGIVIFFLLSLLVPAISIPNALLGILLGGGSLWAVAAGYQLIAGKEGMGGGDIKLLAMIGALLGVQGVIFTIFFSSMIGTLGGVLGIAAERLAAGDDTGQMALLARKIPFGPYLSLAAAGYVFWGQAIIDWYFGFYR